MKDATTRSLRAIVLDFDGTIAQTERDGRRVAFNAAFVAFGFSWYWDEVGYARLVRIADPVERLAHYIATEQPEHARELPMLAIRLRAEMARRFENLSATIPLRPGVEALVRRAHAAGIRTALATATAPVIVENVLAKAPQVRAALGPLATVTYEERRHHVGATYSRALEALAVAAHDALALVGTSDALQAAAAAGLTVAAAPDAYAEPEALRGAALVLDDLDAPEVLTRLRELFER